jgi:hypothetical protein
MSTVDRCVSSAAILVHSLMKQAGTFIPLHLETAGTAGFRR